MRYLLLALFTTLAYAQADSAMERVCFSSQSEATRAIPILNTVLVKGQDQIQADGSCLNISYAPKRWDVLDRWLRTRYPQALRSFSTQSVAREKCDMRVYKKTERQKMTTQYGADGQIVMIGTGEQEVAAEETTMLTVLSGDTTTLEVGQQEISIACTKKSDVLYGLAFSLKTLPTQVANLTNPSTPLVIPPKEGQALSTTLDVAPGVEVSLGQIVRDLSHKEKDLEVPVKGEVKQETGSDSTTWTLKVL